LATLLLQETTGKGGPKSSAMTYALLATNTIPPRHPPSHSSIRQYPLSTWCLRNCLRNGIDATRCWESFVFLPLRSLGATREHTYQTGRTWGRGSLLLLFFDCGTKRFWGLGSAFDGRLVFLRALLFVLSVVEGRGVSALRFGRQERAHGGI